MGGCPPHPPLFTYEVGHMKDPNKKYLKLMKLIKKAQFRHMGAGVSFHQKTLNTTYTSTVETIKFE